MSHKAVDHQNGSIDARRGAQTVHRAIDILEAFAVDRPTLSLAHISEIVKLTPPTTHRLLKALQSKDLVVWDPSSRRYSLGSGVMRLATVIIQRDDILNIAHPFMEKLRNETEETIGLHWLVGDQRVCLVELTSPHPVRMASGVGCSYPLFAGAAGKAILAWLPANQIKRVIDAGLAQRKLTEAVARSLPAQLEMIRTVGYAVSTGETVSGATAVATPIFGSGGVVIAALNATGPADRFTPARRKRAIKPLLETAGQIMRQLGRPVVPPVYR